MRLLSEKHQMELPSFKALLWDREQVRYSSFFNIKSYSLVDSSSPAHARMSGPYGNRGNNESREQTIGNGAWCSHVICYLSNRLQRLRRFKVLQISFDYRKSSVLRRHACIPSQLNIDSQKVVKVWMWWPSVFTSPADKRKHGITCLLIFRTYYRYINTSTPLFWSFHPFFKGQRFRTWPYISATRPNS